MQYFYSALFCAYIIIFPGCSPKKGSLLEEALVLAGGNRTELQKVLDRYASVPADSLKYRAACFLIENMPGYCYLEGEALDNWAIYFKCLGDHAKSPQQIIDSLGGVYGRFHSASLNVKYDIQELDSAFLCNNIDRAFETWQSVPWRKGIPFADFCEYLLPYRIGNEKPVDWRGKYQEAYGDMLRGVETDDPVSAARILRDRILERRHNPRFTIVRPAGYPNPDACAADYLNGSCDDVNQFTVFAFRALGIPCAIDFMPVRGDENVGHAWVSLKNGRNEYFSVDYLGPPVYVADDGDNRRRPKPKVFRSTFSRNVGKLALLLPKTSSVPFEFSFDGYRFHDVTRLYSNYLTNLSVPDSLYCENERIRDDKVLYLCTPVRLEWIPVDWAVARKGKVEFREIESGCLYRVARYENETFSFVTGAFTPHRQTGVLKTYTAATGDTSLILYSKFSLERENNFIDRMTGGVFEGADNPDFKNPDTLFVIRERVFRLIHSAASLSDKPYRYVRYKGPENSHCNVSEVRFFSGATLLKGEAIGTPGCFQGDGSHEYGNAFDGKTETSFDYVTPSGGWTGLDLGMPQRITDIAYSPRNFDNYIKAGNVYELLEISREGWRSLGVQTASSDSLRYDGAVGGCLYYIKCLSEGSQERPFYMDDGKMIFL